MTNLCESVCSTRIANQLGSDSWVKELVIKFVWVQMTNFSGTFLSTHTLSLWNSNLWVILLDLQPRWLRNGHTTSNRRRFNIDITSMHREKKKSINFHLISTYFFDVFSMGEKSTLFHRTFFDVMSEKLTSFRRTFFDVNSISEKSISFWRTSFGATSMSEISTSFRCAFLDLISINEKSTLFCCYFRCNLDGKLI